MRRCLQAPREEPLKPGPVERYADRTPAVAAASFAGSLLVTRRPGRAAAVAPERLDLHGRAGARAGERLPRDGTRLVLGLAHEPRLTAVSSVEPEMPPT